MTAKKTAVLFLTCFLFLSLPMQASAKGNALAVLSFENPAYRENLKGFSSASGLAVTEYVMESDEKELSDKITGAKKYDVIFAIGTKAYSAAKKTKLPVVFSMVFAEPSDGGAGVTLAIPAKVKTDKIKEFLPGKKKVGLIYSEESAGAFNQFSSAAAEAGLSVTGKKVEGPEGFSAAFDSLAGAAECFLMLPDTKLYSAQTIKTLFTASIAKKLPVIGLSAMYTKAGAFISLDCDYTDMGTQAGEIAASVGSGEKGKVAYPRKVTVSLNSAVSKTLGLESAAGKADQQF